MSDFQSYSLSRRSFLAGSAAAAALPGVLLHGLPRAAMAAAERARKEGLNVLFLMTDEQHWRSLSLTGNTLIRTPHMDRIGREGARFDNATCVTPYCSPSRASFITGQYPHRHRILTNVSKDAKQPPLKPDAFPNTEMLLHKAGWRTAHRGKWHLGDTGDFACYKSRTYADAGDGSYNRLLAEKLPAGRFKDHPSPGKYLGRPVEMKPEVEKAYRAFKALPNNRLAYIGIIGRSLVPPELLPETQITNGAIEQIERAGDKPFMITASWSPPHDLWVIPEPYYSLVDRSKVELSAFDAPAGWDCTGPSRRLGELMGEAGLREYAAIYHGMVNYIDDQVGRILQRLDELKLAERTLVIFTSDHGDMVGSHRCVGKSIQGFYDDLVRIPLLMRLPGRIRPGTVVSQPVSQIDLMPTILDYAGLPAAAATHGRSLRPLIEGRPDGWRDYAFCMRADNSRMLRTAEHKYVISLRPRQELALYDLRADPHEQRSLAGDAAHAAILRRLHRRLVEVMMADGDPLAAKMPKEPL